MKKSILKVLQNQTWSNWKGGGGGNKNNLDRDRDEINQGDKNIFFLLSTTFKQCTPLLCL